MTRALMAVVHDGVPARRGAGAAAVAERVVGLGLIGGGLMGRELASAAARWIHLDDLGVRPRLVHVCDLDPTALAWYERLADPPRLTLGLPRACSTTRRWRPSTSRSPTTCTPSSTSRRSTPASTCWARSPSASTWTPTRRSWSAVAAHPELLVRCSSEMPFFPGGQEVWRWIAAGRFGRPIEVRSLFLHSSDLDPDKPINWKRRAETNGAYGCLGDLGMHALAPAAARRLGAPRRARAAERHLQRAPRRPTAVGRAVRHARQRGAALPRAARRATSSRCASRPSGSRRAT